MPAVASRGRGRRTINEINMVPFIDVMLVLLIIFMVTATVITPGVINIPSAGKSSRPPDKLVELRIDQDGNISLGGEVKSDALSEREALARVKDVLSTTPDMPFMVSADKGLRYEQVAAMVGKLHDAGVQRVGLAVK